MNEDWRQFFTSGYFIHQEHIQPADRTEFEVVHLTNLLGSREGFALLDLGCGTGRLSLPLAQKGYRVVGIDGSYDLIAIAKRNRLQATEGHLHYAELDMRYLNYYQEFDAVINFGTAFGYCATQSEDLSVLVQIRDALKPGGSFFMEYGNREVRIRSPFGKTWETLGGEPVYIHRAFNCARGIWMEKMTWMEGGLRKKAVLHQRYYAVTELLRMLREVGMVIVGAYGDVDRSPLTIDSPRVLIWAIKKEGGAAIEA